VGRTSGLSYGRLFSGSGFRPAAEGQRWGAAALVTIGLMRLMVAMEGGRVAEGGSAGLRAIVTGLFVRRSGLGGMA